MARTAVNGAVISIAAAYGAAKTFSAITNDSPAEASFAADPSLVLADLVEITSGWQRLDGRIARIANPTGAGPYLVDFEGFNTTSTDRYPAGSGAGSVREITSWTAIGQILGDTFASQGGEQQFLSYQYIDMDDQSEYPTNRTPLRLSWMLHDDIAAAGQLAIETAQDAGTPYAIRIVARDGKKFYGNGYWSIGGAPQMASNDLMKRAVTLALIGGRFTQYAS
jgi:hypothetical protein